MWEDLSCSPIVNTRNCPSRNIKAKLSLLAHLSDPSSHRASPQHRSAPDRLRRWDMAHSPGVPSGLGSVSCRSSPCTRFSSWSPADSTIPVSLGNVTESSSSWMRHGGFCSRTRGPEPLRTGGCPRGDEPTATQPRQPGAGQTHGK